MSTWWAVEWHSVNRLDGDQRHLIWDNPPRLYRTRAQCRRFIDEQYGYIRHRPDLRAEPYGWRVPQAVLVTVQVVSPNRRIPPECGSR